MGNVILYFLLYLHQKQQMKSKIALIYQLTDKLVDHECTVMQLRRCSDSTDKIKFDSGAFVNLKHMHLMGCSMVAAILWSSLISFQCKRLHLKLTWIACICIVSLVGTH